MQSYADKTALCRIGLLLLALCLIVQPEVNAKADTHHEAAFSPQGEALHLILKGIAAAEKEILVAAYSFTSKPIAEALLTAHRRGVSVRVVVGMSKAIPADTQRQPFSPIMMCLSGVTAITPSCTINLWLFDSKHMQTGSFNYSAAATYRNAENVLVLWNVPEIAQIYAQEWQRLWDESIPMPPAY